jgi:hypothetical protein
MKKVEEQPVRTIMLAIAGFAALMIALPDWARLEVAAFAALFAGLAYLVDPDLRGALRFGREFRPRATKAPAKRPAARRAAT